MTLTDEISRREALAKRLTPVNWCSQYSPLSPIGAFIAAHDPLVATALWSCVRALQANKFGDCFCMTQNDLEIAHTDHCIQSTEALAALRRALGCEEKP